MKKFFIANTLMLIFIASIGVFVLSAQTQIASVVKVIQPGLEIKRSGTEEWITITSESIVSTGDRIRTNNRGEAEVTLFNGNGLIQMRPDTELSINRMERNDQGFLIAIGLVTGQTHQKLLPVPETYIGYEFTTPTSTVVTAGGIFDLWLDEAQNTNVLTNDGIIYVGAQRVQLGANQGLRAEANGVLSEIILAENRAQLSASIDGIPARFITEADIQINIRQGPSARTELLGTAFPNQIDRVMGISADENWYRIRHEAGYGWISQRALQIEVDTQHLTSFPPDHIETPRSALVQALPPTPEASTPNVNTNRILATFSYDELELIAHINEWRITENVWPLKPNPVLREMAHAQASYLLSLPRLPGDLHTDAQGRGPRQRALDPTFNWPHYLGPDRVAVGENAYIGNNVDIAMNYWRSSQIHRDATLSSGYREIGVAVVPHPLGNIYLVVFGSRPNVLPVLLEPTSNTLYVSSEAYRFAAPGNWVTDVVGLQFLPTVLSQVDESAWLPWSRQITPPQMSNFAIAYQGDENKLILAQFNPEEDIAWLPANLPDLSANAADATPEPLLEVPQISAANVEPTITNNSNRLFMTSTPAPSTRGN